MNSILTSLTQHAGELILFLLIGVLVLAGLYVKAQGETSRVRNRFRDLLEGTRGETLELLLKDHLTERLRLQAEVEKLEARTQVLETKMRRTKRHLGFVRYDAFDDVGGAQSFALALYDDEGDGAVLNSLVGRTDCRVYCKALTDGKSDRNLSTEELEAVDIAVEGNRNASRVPK